MDNCVPFKVREFADEDLDIVADLEKQCFSCPMSKQNISAFLLCKTGKGFVCIDERSDKIVAYGGFIFAANEAQMLNIATDKEYRRMGCAKKILCEIDNYSLSHSINSITLEVRENNLPAENLYKSCGYYEVGRIKNYYKAPKEDALILKKDYVKQM